MTRIRYTKKDHLLICTKSILCNNKFVKAHIDLQTMKYFITDANTEELIDSGCEKSLELLKKRMKKSLKSIGAVFYDEVRNTYRERKLIIETTNC
jgi:hypothetical protein